MKDNKFIPQLNIPKTYEQFLLETQFEKQSEQNQAIAGSYQAEYEAKVAQGSQYGPGRSNFSDLCRRIKNCLGSYITGRISCDSDSYYNGNNYAGAVIYAINGNFAWTNSGGDAAGRGGKSFYFIIKCTNYWDPSVFNAPGAGVVHDYLIRRALGFDLSNSSDRYTVCGGGFAYQNGSLRFNSYPLNQENSSACESNGRRELSPEEERIVRYCWDEQYTKYGPDRTFEIPSNYLP